MLERIMTREECAEEYRKYLSKFPNARNTALKVFEEEVLSDLKDTKNQLKDEVAVAEGELAEKFEKVQKTEKEFEEE